MLYVKSLRQRNISSGGLGTQRGRKWRYRKQLWQTTQDARKLTGDPEKPEAKYHEE